MLCKQGNVFGAGGEEPLLVTACVGVGVGVDEDVEVDDTVADGLTARPSSSATLTFSPLVLRVFRLRFIVYNAATILSSRDRVFRFVRIV